MEAKFNGDVSLDGCRHRPNPQRRETVRSAGPAIHEGRSGHQSQDGQGTRPYRSAIATRHRQRGDRVKGEMSAFGPKRTCVGALQMSAFGGKADMVWCSANVRL